MRQLRGSEGQAAGWTTRFDVRYPRLLALGVAVLLAVACLASGKTYLWCVPMGRVMDECCMAMPHDPSDVVASDEAPSLNAVCCDSRSIDTLPVGVAPAAALAIPPAVASCSVLELAPLATRRPSRRRSATSMPSAGSSNARGQLRRWTAA